MQEKGHDFLNLLVIEDHRGCGTFPLFIKGAVVRDLSADKDYPTHAEAIWGDSLTPHWVSCVINGYETFIPEIYIADGILTQNYNPTEIIVEKGQHLTLIALVFEWMYVKDEYNNEGWLPTSKVISS